MSPSFLAYPAMCERFRDLSCASVLLVDVQVTFGLLRLGFGTGRFRRTKYIFVHWSGYVVVSCERRGGGGSACGWGRPP